MTSVGRACRFLVVHGCKDVIHRGFIKVCGGPVPKNMRLFDYHPQDKRKLCTERVADPQRYLITQFGNCPIWGSELMRTVCDVISATGEGPQMPSRRWRGKSKLQGRDVGDSGKEKASVDALLIEPFQKTQKTDSTPDVRHSEHEENADP